MKNIIRRQFEKILNLLYVDVLYTPIEKRTDNETGDDIETYGEQESIKVILNNPSDNFTLKKEGLSYEAPSKIYLLPELLIKRGDLIEFDSKVYKVHAVNTYDWNGQKIYHAVEIYLFQDKTIDLNSSSSP
jgi:hypothetical protein